MTDMADEDNTPGCGLDSSAPTLSPVHGYLGLILRLPGLLAIWTVKILYQNGIGRLIPKVCRFEPSCSNYMIEAIATHGLIKGGLLGFWRLLRCQPFCRGGYDPVPPRRGAHICEKRGCLSGADVDNTASPLYPEDQEA